MRLLTNQARECRYNGVSHSEFRIVRQAFIVCMSSLVVAYRQNWSIIFAQEKILRAEGSKLSLNPRDLDDNCILIRERGVICDVRMLNACWISFTPYDYRPPFSGPPAGSEQGEKVCQWGVPRS